MPARKTNPNDQSDNETSQSLLVSPLTTTRPIKKRSVGRPEKLTMPDLPQMPMTDVEQSLFDYFMQAYQEQYPDLLPTDLLLLHLAALEYIKYLRVVAEELETHKVISMARQHPGVNMRALLDQLSVTRRARTARSRPEEDQDAKELKKWLMGMSQKRA